MGATELSTAFMKASASFFTRWRNPPARNSAGPRIPTTGRNCYPTTESPKNAASRIRGRRSPGMNGSTDTGRPCSRAGLGSDLLDWFKLAEVGVTAQAQSQTLQHHSGAVEPVSKWRAINGGLVSGRPNPNARRKIDEAQIRLLRNSQRVYLANPLPESGLKSQTPNDRGGTTHHARPRRVRRVRS